MLSMKITSWRRHAAVLLLPALVCASLAVADEYVQHTPSTIGEMTSDTLKSAPDGTTPDTRTTIGLLEQVVCSIDSNTWSDKDCNVTKDRIEDDTIGDRVWAAAGAGEINPSGVTGSDSTTLTADDDPGICVVLVHVYDSGTKFDDAFLQRYIAFTVIKPTGETTVFDQWDGPASGYESTLTPLSVCFGNISVTEVNGVGSNDLCHFQGSQYQAFEALTGGTWGVNNDNEWGNDWLSWGSLRITYYRQNPAGAPSAPCSTHIAQEMHVVEGTSGMYIDPQHMLDILIGVNTIGSTRNDAFADRAW